MRSAAAVRRTAPMWAVVIGFALVAVALISLRPAEGADHADAPGTKAQRAADIADLYAFRSPTNADNLVIALTVNPLTAPPENAASQFATDVDYNVHVDANADLVPDATVTVRFSGSGGRTFTVTGLGSPISGNATLPSAQPGAAPAPAVTTSGGVSVFAGQRDDPFFFDLVGFQNFLANPVTPAAGLRPAGESPSDTLAGTNVSAIVIEVPVTAITGAADANTGVIRAWSTTSRSGARVDRMGIPTINTALIPSGMKDAFNAGDPANDVAAFGAAATAQVAGLRAAVAPVLPAENGGPLGDLTPETVSGALIPDVVTIDFSQPLVFPNGRQLADDVIDAALGIVLNRGGAAGVSDGVDGNDRAFSSTFPYLAAPHQPAAGTTTTPAPAPASTGNAGMSTTDGGNAALMTALLAGGAALVVVGGAVALRRRRSQ